MKRRYWVFLFVLVFGLTSLFFSLRSEVHAAVAAYSAAQSVVSVSSEPIAFLAQPQNLTNKYGDCIRIARRAGGDCLR